MMSSRRVSFVLIAILAWSLSVPTAALAQQTVFVVRHAERADTQSGAPPMGGSDPDLSPTGHARAQALAGVLRDADIRTIFVTEYKRTQQTAAPLARLLGIQPSTIVAKDTPSLVAAIKDAPGAVLVVGHSNSVPDVLKLLGAGEPITIGDNDYDDLFVVTLGTPAKLLHLHYRSDQ